MAKVDFRLVEAQKPNMLLKRLKEHMGKEGFGDIEVINHVGYEPAKTSPKDSFIVRVVETAEQVYGMKPVVWPTAAGTSPIYLIKNWMRIPVASAGGVDYPGSRVHAPDENIRIQDYVKSIGFAGTLIGSNRASVKGAKP